MSLRTDPTYELSRARTRDGEETTVYLVRHPLPATRLRVVSFEQPTRLDRWCAASGVAEAIVAGFFVRAPHRPLGEVLVGGRPVVYEPIAAPWGERRGCVHVGDGAAHGNGVTLAPREELPAELSGDLVQAGPLLVRDGEVVLRPDEDREGFSEGSAQFDSDITAERHPRCALGVSDDELLAVCCDGRRSGVDAGLDLVELAELMRSFGARDAINLDGGGSATLVHRGHLLNRPYSDRDQPSPESRPVVTALVFELRSSL
ncbi:phosphodiester glycosidase family protein [Conexibacter sp. CPCC 206217]|uniref:phosphodiester glycosidase family protein n=1 Tax=Conexibacter sp. CPCC 206217 TaxID=3064574 RepID=UPI0027218E06|nr:phosphodiester glycosidase family protein [Conexibacter sp. CPCC 206217]MDO8212613.1 phosphodiester glycosidase family protein [Conexibacter sp. CPCC 206217]